jgi:signal transduction histidine kinase
MTSHQPISALTHPTPSRLRGVREGSLRRALFVILALGLLLGIIQIGAGVALADVVWPIYLFTAVFWTWLTAGLLAWWRRPENGVGWLLIVGAAAIYLGGIGNVPTSAFGTISAIFATSVLAVSVHILHAFPSGRLRGRLSIATVVLAYIVAVGFDTVLVLMASASAETVVVVEAVQTTAGIVVMLVTAFVLARRLMSADRAHRRVLLPLFLYGILTVLLVPAAPLLARALGVDPVATAIIQLALIGGLPIAFLLGIMLGGFRRTTAIEALSAWLAIGGATRPAVARALASTLGDDSLRVVYWAPERGSYVDETGAELERSESDPSRAWMDVRVQDRLVGAIGYDSRLIADASAVRRAGEVLAIAIDRERLTAELMESNDALMKSRLRLVEAAYRERSRIARDLHDGLQVQLVLLALEAQTIANSTDAVPSVSAASEQLRRGIDAAAADLRSLVHNVLPATLFEQGLAAAAEDLVDRLAIPATLSADIDDDALTTATVHTAYLVLAEALANAVKHSRAASVDVRLRQDDDRLLIEVGDDGVGGARVDGGTGLRGLADRVAAVDGSIEIESDRGAGTRVRVVLPCA